MSWGWRITLLYSGFACMILFMVYLTMQENVDLVSKDYYKQEIDFQDRIDSRQNSKALADKFSVSYLGGTKLKIHFPCDLPSGGVGKILLFRPSDAFLDEQFDYIADTSCNTQIQLTKACPGLYVVKSELIAGGKKYYFEESFFLQP